MLPTVLSPRTPKRHEIRNGRTGLVVYLSPFCPLSQDTGIWKREDTISNGASKNRECVWQRLEASSRIQLEEEMHVLWKNRKRRRQNPIFHYPHRHHHTSQSLPFSCQNMGLKAHANPSLSPCSSIQTGVFILLPHINPNEPVIQNVHLVSFAMHEVFEKYKLNRASTCELNRALSVYFNASHLFYKS